MAALLLHQACEHLYQCVLWSLTLHGPRTHALDELRESAEALDIRLREAWPRETRSSAAPSAASAVPISKCAMGAATGSAVKNWHGRWNAPRSCTRW
jgi:HEPN domain-containing protein